ncbi:MAG TPA: plastocyanin/azurin family copper-binding protein [Acidimicrobiia bacterium]|nr:plastocyanin/azurin family copper-binding protein [Acidimicrobiia bacterium]
MRKYLSLVSILLIVVACSGSGAEGEAIGGENVTVQMFDNRFEYTEINVPVGGTVTFVNAGANPHNAVEANGEWSTEDVFGSLDMFEGDEATLTFDTPGEYVFFCTYHGNSEGEGMAGTLIVGDE